MLLQNPDAISLQWCIVTLRCISDVAVTLQCDITVTSPRMLLQRPQM